MSVLQNRPTLSLFLINVFLILMLIAIPEVVMRISSGDFTFLNYAERGSSNKSYPVKRDPVLGWVPRPFHDPNYHFMIDLPGVGMADAWGGGHPLTVDAHGFRATDNPFPADPGMPAILVAGDSFPFGDQGGNRDSWPSQLERRIAATIKNGGVPGYGLDQTLLRVEREVSRGSFAAVVVSYIPDDLNRAADRVFGGQPKPFFTLDGNQLVFHDLAESVGLDGNPSHRVGVWAREILGYSLAIHKIMSAIRPDLWLPYYVNARNIRSGADKVALNCALMKRLADLKGPKVFVLAEYGKDSTKERDERAVMACAIAVGLTVIDLEPDLVRLKETDPVAYNAAYTVHMTAAGNAVVADIVARALVDAGVAASRGEQPVDPRPLFGTVALPAVVASAGKDGWQLTGATDGQITARADAQIYRTLPVPAEADSLGFEIAARSTTQTSTMIVDLVWLRDGTEILRNAPSFSVTGDKVRTYALEMVRPAKANEVLMILRAWRPEDGPITLGHGMVFWH